MAWPKGKPRKPAEPKPDSLSEFVEHLGEQVSATEINAWRALGTDLVRILREQQNQRVSVMATESHHVDLARARSAVFETLIARAEALLK